MLKRLFIEEKGQSMVLFAVFIIVLIGFAGLAIDGGRLYLAKSQLQKAVDAGALAGADALLDEKEIGTGFNYSVAETKAENIAQNNYDSGIPYKPKAESDYVQVYGEEEVTLFLMPLLKIKNITKVGAKAKVVIGDVVKADKGALIPIGINVTNPSTELIPGKIWDLTTPPGDGNSGKYGFLDFSTIDPEKKNQGTKDLNYYIQHGSPVPISIGDPLDIREGKPINPLDIGKKIVYLPIVSSFKDIKNKEKVTVQGFVAFELIPPGKHSKTIQGKLIRTVMPGDIGNVTIEYGSYASKLVE